MKFFKIFKSKILISMRVQFTFIRHFLLFWSTCKAENSCLGEYCNTFTALSIKNLVIINILSPFFIAGLLMVATSDLEEQRLLDPKQPRTTSLAWN